MIEVNLIPDVKLELLKAKRVQTNVISISILITVIAAGVVVLLAFYVFAVQAIAEKFADDAIKSEYADLQNVEDLPQTLTIQNQLENIDSLHKDKLMSSRIFDIASTIVPSGKNAVAISKLSLDTEDGVISIEGEANNGYEALEVFIKTIEQTTFTYVEDGQTQDPVPIATKVTVESSRDGQDDEGKSVLRFSLSFEYAEELFLPTSEQGRVVAPDKQNATDSALGVPKSLFTNAPSAEEEDQ